MTLRDIVRHVIRTFAFIPALIAGFLIHDGLTHGWKRAFLEDFPARAEISLFIGLFAAFAFALYKLACGDLRLAPPGQWFRGQHSSNADPP